MDLAREQVTGSQSSETERHTRFQKDLGSLKLRVFEARVGARPDWSRRIIKGTRIAVVFGLPYMTKHLTRQWYSPEHLSHMWALPLLVLICCGMSTLLLEFGRSSDPYLNQPDLTERSVYSSFYVMYIGALVFSLVVTLHWLPVICALVYSGYCILKRDHYRRPLRSSMRDLWNEYPEFHEEILEAFKSWEFGAWL